MITEINWTDAAWERFRDTRIRHGNLRAYYGDPIACEHEAEFLAAFERVTFAAGPVNVQTDGNHSFLIITPHIVIGLIWTPDSDETMAKRIKMTPIAPDWPRTGRWSTHS